MAKKESADYGWLFPVAILVLAIGGLVYLVATKEPDEPSYLDRAADWIFGGDDSAATWEWSDLLPWNWGAK